MGVLVGLRNDRFWPYRDSPSRRNNSDAAGGMADIRRPVRGTLIFELRKSALIQL